MKIRSFHAVLAMVVAASQANAGLTVVQSAISATWAGTPTQTNIADPNANSTVNVGGAGNASAFSFTPASTFTLDYFTFVYAGGPSTGYLTIYDLGSGQGGGEADGYVNSAFNDGVLVTPQAFTVGGTGSKAFLTFDLTGLDEITLNAGTRYMFDFTAAVAGVPTNGSYAGVDASPDWNFFLARGGQFDTSGSNVYVGAETATGRNDVVGGARRDLALAFYAVPEPSAVLLGGLGALGLLRRRRA